MRRLNGCRFAREMRNIGTPDETFCTQNETVWRLTGVVVGFQGVFVHFGDWVGGGFLLEGDSRVGESQMARKLGLISRANLQKGCRPPMS